MNTIYVPVLSIGSVSIVVFLDISIVNAQSHEEVNLPVKFVVSVVDQVTTDSSVHDMVISVVWKNWLFVV